MDEQSRIKWNWPADELDNPRRQIRGGGVKDSWKYVIAFLDEAVILLLIIYLIYRFFG